MTMATHRKEGASGTTAMTFTKPKDSDNCQDRQIVDEATEWLMSLEDRECAALRDGAGQPKGFLKWLNRSPEHIRVFLEISHAHYSLSAIDAQELVEAENPAEPDGDERSNVINLRIPKHNDEPVDESWLRAVGTVRSRRQPVSRRSKWVVASALSAVAIGAGTWLSAGSSATGSETRSVLTTQVGERSITQFEDGSAVYLNTATNMELQSDRHFLSGHLASGEVFFQIPSNSRPLSLSVGGLRLDSPGGQLDVRHEAGETQIAVLEGRVRLSCDCAPQEVVLPAGFQLHIDSATGLRQIQPQPLTRLERDNLSGWRDGRLNFEGQSLAEAVRELNRYNRRKIVLGDSDIAGRPVDGNFSATDIDGFVASIVQKLEIRAQPAERDGNDASSVLLSAAAPPASQSTTP
jgi:transmembrane sensor